MPDYIEKKCPQCDQKLRFPKNVGGILMVCPSCGKKFYSDFKLGGIKKSAQRGIVTTIFEMPCTIMSRLRKYFLQ